MKANMSDKKGKKSERLVTGAVPLSVHLAATKQANEKYLRDTGKSDFNNLSGEGSNPRLNAMPRGGLGESNEIGHEGSLQAEGHTYGGQTQLGAEIAAKSKRYFFRNPGRNRSKIEAAKEQPNYIKEKRKRGTPAGTAFMREQGLSTEAAFGRSEEDFTSARLGGVLEAAEKNYYAVKAKKEAKKRKPTPKPKEVNIKGSM
jgi:hypothetical protein